MVCHVYFMHIHVVYAWNTPCIWPKYTLYMIHIQMAIHFFVICLLSFLKDKSRVFLLKCKNRCIFVGIKTILKNDNWRNQKSN